MFLQNNNFKTFCFWQCHREETYNFLKSVFLSQCFVSVFSGDNLSYHNGSMFSTWDQDNDYRSDHCSQYYHGAWWYHSCYTSNLNGKYMGPGVFNDLSMNWKWASGGESLKSTRMMIRPLNFWIWIRSLAIYTAE